MDANRVLVIDQALSNGRSLEDIGVFDRGLTRQQALAAIEILYANQIPILGGDVYRLTVEGVESVGDSWNYTRKPRQIKEEYVEQCYKTTKDYIKNYKGNENEILFALVPERDLVF